MSALLIQLKLVYRAFGKSQYALYTLFLPRLDQEGIEYTKAQVLSADFVDLFFSDSQPLALKESHVMSNFDGTEIEIWAGFGPADNTEKKIGPSMSNFCWCFFHRQKKIKK